MAHSQSLRDVDPLSFGQLTPGCTQFEQHAPSRWLLALEYVATSGVAAAALVLHVAGITPLSPLCAVAWVVLHALCFAHGTSPMGLCGSAWYEHATWCYRLPALRIWAVVLLETAYCAASLGLGGVWSIAHRCWGSGRQSVAERLLHARMIVEQPRPMGAARCCCRPTLTT